MQEYVETLFLRYQTQPEKALGKDCIISKNEDFILTRPSQFEG